MTRTYDWNGHTHEIRLPERSDEEIAVMVRMLMRGDLAHEMVCVTARDRIMALAKEKAALEARVKELESFAEEIRDQWDCDRDAHKYDTTCRCCEAAIILGESR